MDGHGILPMWGQLLPHFEDIEPEDEKGADTRNRGSTVSTLGMKSHVSFLTLSQRNARRRRIYHLWFKLFPEAGIETSTCTLRDNHQKGKSKALLPFQKPLAEEVQRYAEEQDKLLTPLDEADQQKQEENTQTLEDENILPSLWGGVPSSVVDQSYQSFENIASDRVDRVFRSN